MAKANSYSEDTLGARKRKLGDIMRNEPKRVTRYPILLSSTRKKSDVASTFFEVWLDEKYQEDFFIVKYLARLLQGKSAIIPIRCDT